MRTLAFNLLLLVLPSCALAAGELKIRATTNPCLVGIKSKPCSASSYCSHYLTSTQTATTGFPTFASSCGNSPSSLSNACSELISSTCPTVTKTASALSKTITQTQTVTEPVSTKTKTKTITEPPSTKTVTEPLSTKTITEPPSTKTVTAVSTVTVTNLHEILSVSVSTATDIITDSFFSVSVSVSDSLSISTTTTTIFVPDTTTLTVTATDAVTFTLPPSVSTTTTTLPATTLTVTATAPGPTTTVGVTGQTLDISGCPAIAGNNYGGANQYIYSCGEDYGPGSFALGTTTGYSIEDCAEQCFDNALGGDCLGVTFTSGGSSSFDGAEYAGTCTLYSFPDGRVSAPGMSAATFAGL